MLIFTRNKFPLLLCFSPLFLFFLHVSAANPRNFLVNSSPVNNIFWSESSENAGNTETPFSGNLSDFSVSGESETEKILVVLEDSYGILNFSKIIITDVDMELSVLIAKDIFGKFPDGLYTVIASSANDLISQKLIIQ